MADKKLFRKIEKYINKYYEPEDTGSKEHRREKKRFFLLAKIAEFREKWGLGETLQAPREDADGYYDAGDDADDSDAGEYSPSEFDAKSVKKTKLIRSMSKAAQRSIEDLMSQREETFSERLLRMIDERGLEDSEVYTKAHIDRRHFSKIRKDVDYAPNKKTVLAFAIALELSLDEAKDLLQSAGFALSRSSKRDIIVAYFLQNKLYDMFEINEVLDAYDQPVFA
ncbi:MAG: hypothetical protein Q4C60_08365 [Eubacteriales bacterium]|nr:hypothetical protein [Eubacteriales bacterium]